MIDACDCDCGAGDCCGPSDCDCCGPGDCNCCGPEDCGGCGDCCTGFFLGALCCGSCNDDPKNRPHPVGVILITLLVLVGAIWFITRNKEEKEPAKPKIEKVEKKESKAATEEVKTSGWQKAKTIIHELTK